MSRGSSKNRTRFSRPNTNRGWTRCGRANAPFFVDAAHFVHGAFLGMVWCFVRYFLPTPAGRKRFNVLGAVDALTKEIITVVNETPVNAETVCQLLRKMATHVSAG